MTQALVRVASPNPPSDTAEVAEVAEGLLAAIPGVDDPPRRAGARHRQPGRARARQAARAGASSSTVISTPSRSVTSAGWTVPPLSGALRDGRLYGRGVSDMKGGLACSILAAALLAEHRDAWSGEVVLTLAGDEENMGSLGTGYLLEHVPEARGDANICGDVGSPMVVRFGEKGLLWIEIEATGVAAHGAHVHKGVNAIDRLRAALDRVKELERLPVAAPESVAQAIEAARSDVREAVRRRRIRDSAARDRQHRHH